MFMRRSFVQKVIVIGMALLTLGIGAFSISQHAHASLDQRIPISSQTVPLVKQSRMLHSAGAGQQLDLSIALRARNQPAMDQLLQNLYNPGSPQYHHFLTPQQFAARFGPTSAQLNQVMAYLSSQGMTITQVSPSGLLIDARANVSTAETAFEVQINNYQYGQRQFFANAGAPTVPSNIAPLILSIGGMDNSVQPRALAHRVAEQPVQAKPSRAAPRISYGPTDLNGAYDANPLKQAGIAGNNQTIAVFELDGFKQSDITHYLNSNNLGIPNISTTLVDGFNGSAGAGAIEVELDIEVVAAMAPKASQIVYEGPNTTQGVNDTYTRIVDDNKAQIATISWGECEAQSGSAELQTLDAIFKRGAVQGISMFAASGDSGAYDCNDNNLAVDSPAGDPNITGVGGTNLQTSGGTYGNESVWSSPTDTQRSPRGAGGGGGISNTFTQPSWQVGPGVQNQYSNGNREVPDVSADADPQTGYAVYCTVLAAGCPFTGNITVGGTSAAAPLWAGSMALINQYLQQQNRARVGFANPALYALANAQQQFPPFHDVTSGNNLFYPATANYDEASGLGSPDIYNLARDLVNRG
jgi:subtilase family serine protease